MLFLLVLLFVLLSLGASLLLPITWSGIIAFGGSALLAPWIYTLVTRWVYHEPAPQSPCELLALPLRPLRLYMRGVRWPRLLLYTLLAVALYLLLSWLNGKLVVLWPDQLGGAKLRLWSKQAELAQSTLLKDATLGWLIVIVGVLTPIAEELFFRGAIMGWMIQRGLPRWSVLLLPALLFTVMHLNPRGMLPIFFLALILGQLRWTTRSLFPSVGLHLCNNLLVVLIYGIF